MPYFPDKPQSLIPTEVHHPQWPTLQNQIESQRALSSGVKRPQEVFSVPTSTHPEDSRVAAMLPEKWPNSPEIRKKLEQHLQERFIRHQWELPGKIQETVELKRLQGELPGTAQAWPLEIEGPSHTQVKAARITRRWDCGSGKTWAQVRQASWGGSQKISPGAQKAP